jgi:hypothetical protein
MPDLTLLHPLLAHWTSLVPLLAILILVKVLTSARFKGWFGERMVIRGLRRLDPAVYRHFHDLYLPRPDGAGSTQIGIFVIETKNYRGWIFGDARQRQWTQQIYRRKSRFQNPLHQNNLHVRALAESLQLPATHFHSLILFLGSCEFKTPRPENLLTRGLVSRIRSHTRPTLTDLLRLEAIRRLEDIDSADRKAAAREHLAGMRRRRVAE